MLIRRLWTAANFDTLPPKTCKVGSQVGIAAKLSESYAKVGSGSAANFAVPDTP